MKPKRPKHCKGCESFHSAGRPDPKGGMEKYNAWCCRNGQPASKSIGWCKTHGMKVPNACIQRHVTRGKDRNMNEQAIKWMDDYYEGGGLICDRCPGSYYERATNAGWCKFAEYGNVVGCLAMPDGLLTESELRQRISMTPNVLVQGREPVGEAPAGTAGCAESGGGE